MCGDLLVREGLSTKESGGQELKHESSVWCCSEGGQPQLNYISMNMRNRLKDVIISLYRTLLITSRVLYLGWLLKTRKFLTYIFEFNEQLSRKLGG